MPKFPAFKDKARILLASLRSIPDKNCYELVRGGACFFPTWRCRNDPGFQLLLTRLLLCILVCMLSSGLFSTPVLPTRPVPMGRKAYCSHWARCKELHIAFFFFCIFSLLFKGQSCQVDVLCSCAVDHSGKLVFPSSAVPISYFISPGILPVLPIESCSPLISFSPAMQILSLNLVLKKK